MKLSVQPDRLAVCQIPKRSPQDFTQANFWSLTCTPDETSLILPEAEAQEHWVVEPGWRALKVHGPLDFSLTGILAAIAQPLAQAGISIFALSTYNTDYVLVKEIDLEKCKQALEQEGHTLYGMPTE